MWLLFEVSSLYRQCTAYGVVVVIVWRELFVCVVCVPCLKVATVVFVASAIEVCAGEKGMSSVR
jgi:hypothetical protein